VAGDAPHHPRTPRALALDRVPGLGGSVAEAWTGDTRAELLGRLIAVRGRPAASRTDGGGARHPAGAFLEEPGLARPGLDERAHAVAGRLTRSSHAPPTFATFVAACGRVSGTRTRTHTLLACVAPPTVRPTDLPPHFEQVSPYNSLGLLMFWDRKSAEVPAYILRKLLWDGKAVPNASSIAF
jgi:hypothetical protein